jgi:hypothetical protein
VWHSCNLLVSVHSTRETALDSPLETISKLLYPSHMQGDLYASYEVRRQVRSTVGAIQATIVATAAPCNDLVGSRAHATVMVAASKFLGRRRGDHIRQRCWTLKTAYCTGSLIHHSLPVWETNVVSIALWSEPCSAVCAAHATTIVASSSEANTKSTVVSWPAFRHVFVPRGSRLQSP